MPKQGEIARRPAWPEDTVFRRLVLDVESDSCEHCGATLHVCDRRFHRIHTLQGPVELPCLYSTCFDANSPRPVRSVHGQNHAKARLPSHHLRVGIRRLVEWDGLDHGRRLSPSSKPSPVS